MKAPSGRRRLAGVLAGFLVTVASLVWVSVPAGAHALLTASTPSDGASVEPAPTEAVLTFTEAPDPVLSVVHVLDATGKQTESGRAGPVRGQATQLRVPLGPLAQGTYTVVWRVTSVVDGHTTLGSVAFGVGVPAVAAPTEGVQRVVQAPAPTGVSVAGRWLFYVGVVLLLGAAVVGVAVVADPVAVSRRLLAAAWAGAAVGLVLTIADYRATARTGLVQLLSSPTGHKLVTQAFAVMLAGVAVAWAWVRRDRLPLAAVGAGASAVMLARAAAGHANASSPRWFAVGTQWVHLVAAGAWVGGLAWLLVALRRGDPGRGRGLARRFSSVAAVTLAVVAASGTARALDEVGAWKGLFDTSFGVALSVKVGLFAALAGLGALSRFRHVPAAAVDRRRLQWSVRAEVAIAAGVLAVTALLAGLPPSSSVAEASRSRPDPSVSASGHDYATSVRVRLVVDPGSAGPNHFDSTVVDYDTGEPVRADAVSLRFRLHDRPDVPTSTLALAREADGHWRGTGSALSVQGRWGIVVLVQTPADAVEVPMELTVRPATRAPSTAAPGNERTCGDGTPDPSYSVTLDSAPSPPKAEGTTFHLTVRQEGRPVTGAKVCLAADMPDMPHPGVQTVARAGPPGRYDADLKFTMTGSWSATVTIAEPGRPVVSVRTGFEVK